jgi:hypothetical protein
LEGFSGLGEISQRGFGFAKVILGDIFAGPGACRSSQARHGVGHFAGAHQVNAEEEVGEVIAGLKPAGTLEQWNRLSESRLLMQFEPLLEKRLELVNGRALGSRGKAYAQAQCYEGGLAERRSAFGGESHTPVTIAPVCIGCNQNAESHMGVSSSRAFSLGMLERRGRWLILEEGASVIGDRSK